MKESFLRWRENNREEKRAEGKEKWERGHRPVLIVLCVLFGLYALTIIYPLVWMLINSLKTKQEFLNNPWPLPQELMFNNYAEVFKLFNLGSMLFNSLSLSLTIPTALQRRASRTPSQNTSSPAEGFCTSSQYLSCLSRRLVRFPSCFGSCMIYSFTIRFRA